MGSTSQVPDAWDDDWEPQAEPAPKQNLQQPAPQALLSKAERLAQHAETNRKLWQSADSPDTFHYIEASSTVPQATTNFKPQVKVLSRKPMIAKRDPTQGAAQLGLDDDGEDDARKEVTLSPEQIRAKQKRDREEKQRRYEEARAKIFGDSAPSSGASSPGTTTPPRTDSRGQGRGRGRGGGLRNNDNRQFDNRRTPNSSGSGRELFDPNYLSKPESMSALRRGGDDFQGRVQQQQQQPAIRAPRGPDGSGRGGFGFARRGDRDG
ncbi:hypothetical protein S40288_08987 [Stachybotrys chartarum IBT 40288]|nr:hypothetical protein S40288_08987 [Stachybotrys chartarum IBT 40288]